VVAAATIATGLANVAKIATTEFVKRKEGGIVGSDFRTIVKGDFGDGENRLVIANTDEFIVNGSATRSNRALLEAINGGVNFTAVGSASGGRSAIAEASGGSMNAEFRDFTDRTVDAIANIRIEMKSILDGQEFLRRNFRKYEKIERDVTV
jgi:hypothetical protein